MKIRGREVRRFTMWKERKEELIEMRVGRREGKFSVGPR